MKFPVVSLRHFLLHISEIIKALGKKAWNSNHQWKTSGFETSSTLQAVKVTEIMPI